MLPAALSRRASEFAPFTDQAVLEMQVLHATRALHLLGPYSRYHWNHPGPFFFYLMAPLYALSGEATRSIWISVWLLNVASIAGIVWIASGAGRLPAYIVGALLAWQTLVLGPAMLCDPWGPLVVVLPFELCAFACVAISRGEPRWLPLVAIAGSFVTQTNVGTALAVLGGVSSGIALGLTDHGKAGLRAWLESASLALVVAGFLWAPPLVEELRSAPGNLTKLRNFFVENEAQHSYREAFRAVSEHLAAVLRVDAGYPTHASASAITEPTRASLLGAKLLLACLPPTAVLSWVRDRRDSTRACVCAAATAASALYSATHVVEALMSYLFMWTAGIGTLTLWLVLGEGAPLVVRRIPPLPGRARRLGRPVALAAAAGALLYAHEPVPGTPFFYGRRVAEIRDLAEPLETYLRERRVKDPVVRVGTSQTWGIMAGVLLRLYKERIPFAIEREWLFMFGEQFRSNVPPSAFIVFGDAAYEADARNIPGCLLLGQSAGTFVFASPAEAEADGPGIEDPCP